MTKPEDVALREAARDAERNRLLAVVQAARVVYVEWAATSRVSSSSMESLESALEALE
jgi:hypothetical protein